MSQIPTQQYSPLPIDKLPLLDLISSMGMALKGRQQLNAWCESFYSSPLHVFSGSDPENPPGQDQYPMVELFPLADNAGREIEQYEASIGLVCGVCDESLEPVVYQDFKLQQGIVRLEELFSWIKETIAGADLGGGYISEINAQRDDEALFPFFVLGAEIKIIKPL